MSGVCQKSGILDSCVTSVSLLSHAPSQKGAVPTQRQPLNCATACGANRTGRTNPNAIGASILTVFMPGSVQGAPEPAEMPMRRGHKRPAEKMPRPAFIMSRSAHGCSHAAGSTPSESGIGLGLNREKRGSLLGRQMEFCCQRPNQHNQHRDHSKRPDEFGFRVPIGGGSRRGGSGRSGAACKRPFALNMAGSVQSGISNMSRRRLIEVYPVGVRRA